MKTILPPVRKTMCASCPFREGSKFHHLRDAVARSALNEASRICHSTGQNDLLGDTGKPERLCRGARDLQLGLFYAIGMIAEPTDEAWKEAWELALLRRYPKKKGPERTKGNNETPRTRFE